MFLAVITLKKLQQVSMQQDTIFSYNGCLIGVPQIATDYSQISRCAIKYGGLWTTIMIPLVQ
jgi:hypothetical protein